MTAQENSPPPPSTVAPSVTASLVSSMTGGSSGSSKFCRYNQGGRRYGADQSFARSKQDDLNYLGSKEEYVVVIGGPSENAHLISMELVFKNFVIQ